MKNNLERTRLFESVPVPKAVAKLAVPTVIGSLVMVLYNLADTYFVGMINDPLQTAAVTLAAPVLLAFNAVNNLFGVGTSSVMSRALGAKDHETVRRASCFGIWCAILGGAVISLFALTCSPFLLGILGAVGDTAAPTAEYMKWTVLCGAIPSILNVVISSQVRAEGEALHAGIGTMSGCILNIILDPLFILPGGLNMGAAGAGLATFLSNICACLYYFVFMYIRRGRTFVCMAPSAFRPTRSLVKAIMIVGIPSAIQNLLNVTGMTVLNNFAGAFSPETVSAIGIAHKVTMVPMYIAMGISQGVMPLVGYNFSARNSARMKGAILYTLRLIVLIMLPATLIFLLFPRQIISLFMTDPAVIADGIPYIIGMSLAQPFLGVDFLAVGVFQACGMGSRSLLFAIMRKIVLEIPALFLLNTLFPKVGLGFAQLTAEVILAAAAILLLLKIFRETSCPENKPGTQTEQNETGGA